jgi:hypothetical protein
MLQYHDEGHALWRQFAEKGAYNRERFLRLLSSIHDWDLFLWFCIIDGRTEGKDKEGLRWFVNEVNHYVATNVKADSLL